MFNCKPECTKDACSPATVETQPSILTEFTRTFTWEIKAPGKTAVSLDILGEGLVETSQPCPNGFQYSVAISKTKSNGRAKFCRGGSVTHLDLVNEAVVSLQVKPKALVDPVLFKATAGPLSKKKKNLCSNTVDFSLRFQKKENRCSTAQVQFSNSLL